MRIKTELLIMVIILLLTSCTTVQKENIEMKSNKEKVVDLLKSLETGEKAPISYINSEKYIQHNQNIKDGLNGFGELLGGLPPNSIKVNTVRVFEDGNYVIAHSEYDFFGPKIGFDIFRFEDGLIVEHWDNLQEIVTETKSGRTQIDGFTEVNLKNSTNDNKLLVKGFVDDILIENKSDLITNYISTEKYLQHNPGVGDGLTGLGEALQALAEMGMPMIFEKNHKILGEGDFVLSVSEGIFLNKKVAYYDLFRIENGKIVEHWDTIENIVPGNEAQNGNGKFNFPE